jgi:alanyl-tRNA synthetase
VPEAARELHERVRQAERAARKERKSSGVDVEELVGQAVEVGAAKVLTAQVDGPSAQELLGLADQVRARLGSAAVVLGTPQNGKVDLVAAVAPELVERGVRADDVVRVAAKVVGGGGGGRETLARAGGREAERLPEALTSAREAIESALRG